MRLLETNLGDEIFEFEDQAKITRFFNVTALWPYAVKHGEPISTDITPGLLAQIANNHGIEEDKIARLREPYLSRPLLGVLWPDGSTVMIDGNHRLVRLARDGKKIVNLYRVTLAECEPYLITDVPEGIGIIDRPTQ